MRQRWLVLALVFSGLVNLAAIGTIGYHGWRVRTPRRPFEEMPASLRRELSLDPDQMERLAEHRQQSREEMERIQQSLLETRTRLMELLRSPDPDSMAVEDLLQQMVSSQMAMERKVIHDLLRMRQVLTPEQRERFMRLMERRFRWGGMGPEHGPEHKGRRGPFGNGRRRERP